MIKVVVADDEVKVCQLICNLVDWSTFDMEIVAVAHNGEEALEMVRQHEPDLLVTDIRMPGCDGLEMIARAKQLRECRFVKDVLQIKEKRKGPVKGRASLKGGWENGCKPVHGRLAEL